MVFKHSYILTIIFSLLLPVMFIVTYTSAILNRNVEPVFPYISDTGNWPPESCIFSLVLTIAAILMASMVYIRYRQIRELCEKKEIKPLVKKLNTVSLYLGITSSFGVILLACFQETNVFVMHMLGAVLCFGLAGIFYISQVVMSVILYPIIGTKSMIIWRAICTFIYCVAFLLTIIFLFLSIPEFKGTDITKWGKEDGGYDLHLVSTISEWILVAFNQLIVLSFTAELRLVQFSEPKFSSIIS